MRNMKGTVHMYWQKPTTTTTTTTTTTMSTTTTNNDDDSTTTRTTTKTNKITHNNHKQHDIHNSQCNYKNRNNQNNKNVKNIKNNTETFLRERLGKNLPQTFDNWLKNTPTHGSVLIPLKTPEEKNRSHTLTFCTHPVKTLCSKKLATKNQENA